MLIIDLPMLLTQRRAHTHSKSLVKFLVWEWKFPSSSWGGRPHHLVQGERVLFIAKGSENTQLQPERLTFPHAWQ